MLTAAQHTYTTVSKPTVLTSVSCCCRPQPLPLAPTTLLPCCCQAKKARQDTTACSQWAEVGLGCGCFTRLMSPAVTLRSCLRVHGCHTLLS
jgi:hypothetical protein